MKENVFQAKLIKIIQNRLGGKEHCKILKNDPNYIQGIPDLTIIYGCKWAWLEVKKSEIAPHQQNQDYYIEWAKFRSYGAFIYPENCGKILDELCLYLKS